MSENWDESRAGSFSPWWYTEDKPTASSNIPSQGEEHQHTDSHFNLHLPLSAYPNFAPDSFEIQNNNLPPFEILHDLPHDLPAFTPERGAIQEPEVLQYSNHPRNQSIEAWADSNFSPLPLQVSQSLLHFQPNDATRFDTQILHPAPHIPSLSMHAHAPSLPPPPTQSLSSGFGAIRSMGPPSSVRYSPHQSSASHSQHQSTSTAASASSGDITDWFLGGEFVSALSGTGEAMIAWKNFVAKNAPENNIWLKRLAIADRTAATFVNASLTRDFIHGHLPSDQQIVLSVRKFFASELMQKEFTLFSTSKYTQYDKGNILKDWVSAKPATNLRWTNDKKISWVSKNPFLISLSGAAIDSYVKQLGDSVEDKRALSNQMAAKFLSNNPPVSVNPYKLTSADFILVHSYTARPGPDVAISSNLLQYYGNANFRAVAAEMLKPHLPYIAYVSQTRYHTMLMSLLNIPGAMVC